MNYPLRYLARIIIEAKSPLSIQTGEKGLHTDDQISKDWNGLPIIPGTSLMGVLKHRLEKTVNENYLTDALGGAHTVIEDKKAKIVNIGSRLTISDALLCGHKHQVFTQATYDFGESTSYFNSFSSLPIRDRVRMNERGVSDSEGSGKFEEELIFAGTRFKMEIELMGTEDDKDFWKEIFSLIQTEWRIGGGTRNGYGLIAIVDIEERIYDLKKDITDYIQQPADLNVSIKGATTIEEVQVLFEEGWTRYEADIAPADLYFHFGSGTGNQHTDNTPKKERIVLWNENIPTLDATGDRYLIPAASVKGALAHRAVYFYNQLKNNTIEQSIQQLLQLKQQQIIADMQSKGIAIETITETDLQPYLKNFAKEVRSLYTDDNCPAKKALFGYAKQEGVQEEGQIGNVIVHNVYLKHEEVTTHLFDHVKIDTFSGAAFEGALFNEEVIQHPNRFRLKVQVKNEVDAKSKAALELALFSLTEGGLPLGGMTTKGHGAFAGDLHLIELASLQSSTNT